MDAHGGWAATPADVLTFLFSVDGLDSPPDLLGAARRTAMTMASAVKPPSATEAGYARGWSVNRAGTVRHGGTLPGTQAIPVCPSDERAWCAVCNTGRPGDQASQAEFDDLMWQVERAV
ncbi:serine hydrolase [Streptomyces sp. NPDC053560]|uniref:serine hydrolase n=1 Tax=Streptomyces sp. NPDC053560 TaxID=3365711 RepID=UPI0037D06194